MKKKIVFTGGGTLGHVMPNLYLINELKSEFDCFYIGSSGIEKEKLKSILNDNFHEIPTTKLERDKIFSNFKIPFVLIKAIFSAKKVLKKISPSLIFSKGGYVALPVCIAGRMLKIPIIAHESDYSFGLANKIILSLCTKMCVNFKHLEGKNKKIIYTGAILDKSFDSKAKPFHNFTLKNNLPTILIVGGSLGSKSINNKIVKNVDILSKHFNIIHITGKGNKDIASKNNYNAIEMFEDMPALYNLSDFVIGRSGAGVTAECFYKKIPMFLIPLENSATRGDQRQNADYYAKLGVAKVVSEQMMTEENFVEEILNFNKNLNKYKQAYEKQKIQNGREKVVEIIKSNVK